MVGPIIALCVILLIFSFFLFWMLWEDKFEWGAFLGCVIFAGFGLIAVFGISYEIKDDRTEWYNEGQIDALKGKQAYEIHYVYPKGDTIPSDTLYLKIK